MSSSDFSEIDIEEFDDLVASPLSSPRSRGTLDLSNHHPVDMAPALTPSLPKLTTSSDEKVKEPYVRSTASERSSSAFPPDLSATYKKHERFYFDDGNITFLVEDVLYNVHRYFFCRDSPYFVNLISNRCGDPSISFSQPFVLKDVEIEEFDALLCILYPSNFDECEVKTVADWTSVLRLATRWSLTSIRKLAISHLRHIASAVDKVVLGRTYSVDAWLIPGFVAICQRPQPLTRDEGRRLGVDDAVLVACLRESVYTCSTEPTAEDITTAVQACLKSPDIADKGPINMKFQITTPAGPNQSCSPCSNPTQPLPMNETGFAKSYLSSFMKATSDVTSEESYSSGDLAQLDKLQTNHAKAAPVTIEATAEAPQADAAPAEGGSVPETSAEREAVVAKEATIAGEEADGKMKEHSQLLTAAVVTSVGLTIWPRLQRVSEVDTLAEEKDDEGEGETTNKCSKKRLLRLMKKERMEKRMQKSRAMQSEDD